MTTPTNHTTSSIFNFGDMLEPEPSHSSLEQNSSIEESNIFVSTGGELSNHSRYNSSALSGNGSSKARQLHFVDKNKVVPLVPLQERPKEPWKPQVAAAIAGAEKKTFGNGILKPPSYSGPQQNRDLEQPKLTINTEPKIMKLDNSMSGRSTFAETFPSHPFSPTVHTSNQTAGFLGSNPPQVFSPTVHTSNQTTVLGVHNQQEKLSSADEISMDNIQKVEQEDEQGVGEFTASAIHIALFFLVALTIACTSLVLSVIRNYGFLTLVLVTIVISFCVFLACFVDSVVLSQNPNIRPVRQNIETVMRATRKILEDEYHLFMRDWKECLLLIQGPENYSHNDTEGIVSGDSVNNSGMLHIPPTTHTRRKKSKIFKLIRPLLGLKKNFSRRKKRQHESHSKSIASYKAPSI
mmetsp:Transcript_3764/g.9868  ORF Transcript_3764/g.9868 Transcript_3764/m.9868 type:complete len:408 (+) Transcript_3764:137-1360(+)